MKKLEEFLSSYNLSTPQAWDNTGLLINTNSPCDTILLTIDVTEIVIKECIDKNIHFIFSYHPVIFDKILKIEDKFIKIIQNNISVYSIHTALDKKICTFLCNKINAIPKRIENTHLVAKTTDNLQTIITKCKEIAKMPAIRYVLAVKHTINSVPREVIIGVGSAQNIFKENMADSLIITGEMKHHDMLFYKHNGCSVVLMEHSNSERIYLQQLQKDMKDFGLNAMVAESDKDPVEFYI